MAFKENINRICLERGTNLTAVVKGSQRLVFIHQCNQQGVSAERRRNGGYGENPTLLCH